MPKLIHILPHNIEDFISGGYTNFDHHSVRFIERVAKFWSVEEILEQELWVLSKKFKKIETFSHSLGFKIKVFPISIPLPLPLEISWPMIKAVFQAKKENVLWHLHSYYLIMNDFLSLLLYFKKQKFVIHHRGGGPSWTLKAFWYTVYHYLVGLRIVLNLASFVFVQNYDEKKRVEDFLRIKKEKIIYFPNTVGKEIISKGNKKFGERRNFIIIISGRVEKLISRPLILEKLKKVLANKACKLEIVGVKDNNKILNNFKNSFIGQVDLLPWIRKEALFEKFQLADLLVHPNDKDEGSPAVLVEAGSQGLPLIGFDIAGVRDIIKDDFNGYLVKNAHDLYKKIIFLANNHDRLNELRENSIDIIKNNFTDEIFFPRLVQIYLNLFSEYY